MNATPYNNKHYATDEFYSVMAHLCGRELEEQTDLERVKRWLLEGKDSLLLMGTVGTGKSTIATAICRCWCDYLTIPKFCQCDIIADRIKQDESYKYEL